jgi:non-heme chloroperoxidase
MGMQAGFPAAYDCIKAFSEADFREDLKKVDVPTLVIHGDDDQIVPISVGGARSSKMIKGATLKTYRGAPHGLMTTNKQQFNADLLEFARQQPQAAAQTRRETSTATAETRAELT